MIWDRPILDFHTHLMAERDDRRALDEARRLLIQAADRYRLSRLVVLPLLGGPHPSRQDIAAGNDAAAELAQADPRMIPFATVYPPHGDDALREAEHRVHHQRFAGLKIWCSLADDPCMDPLLDLMAAADKPTLIHALHKATGQLPLESRPLNVARLARRHPKARIVMAHAGGDFLWSCDVIGDCPNVWTDLSGSYCESGMMEHAIDVLGPGRVLFGTDLPGAGFITNLAKVLAADVDEATRSRVLHENARELLG